MSNNYGIVTDKNDPNFGRTKTSVWSRSMGYYRPVDNFNIGKRQEFEERNTFKENTMLRYIANLFKTKRSKNG